MPLTRARSSLAALFPTAPFTAALFVAVLFMVGLTACAPSPTTLPPTTLPPTTLPPTTVALPTVPALEPPAAPEPDAVAEPPELEVTTTLPPTTVPPTTVPPTTVPPTTVPPTTVPPTTVPPTTVPPPAPAPPLAVASARISAPIVAAAGEPLVIARGHVDLIEVTREGATLRVSVKDESAGSGAVFRSPAQVQLRVPDAARVRVPSGPFGFLGAAGSEVFVLPQVQDPDLVWPGWSTERLSTGQLAGDAIRLRLAGVQGPGKVVVFTTDQFGGPSVLFDSSGPPERELVVPIRTHAHANWAFGAAGVYRLTVEVSGDLVGVGPTRTRATYVVLVGDATAPVAGDSVAPPSSVPAGGAGAGPASSPAPDQDGITGTATPAPSPPTSAGAAASPIGSLATTGADSPRLALAGSLVVLAGLIAQLIARRVAGRRHRRCAVARTP